MEFPVIVSEVLYESEENCGTKAATTMVVIRTRCGQKLSVEISEGTICCEKYGVEFTTARKIQVNDKITAAHTVLNDEEQCFELHLEVAGVTSPVILSAYNDHNGYYAHHAEITIGTLIEYKWI